MQRREQVFVMRKFTVRESSLDRVALLVSCSTGLLLYTLLLSYTLLLYTLLLYCGAESKKPV
jgi:hypothetical protein